MAIEQGQCTVFKVNLLKGLENFNTGTTYVYKLALYTAYATLNSNTLVYTTDQEVSGTGYTAGGIVITPIPPSSSGNVAYISFQNATWNPASFTTRGGLIYNSTTGAAVAVLNFGADKTSINTFTVIFPPATASDAIIRLS